MEPNSKWPNEPEKKFHYTPMGRSRQALMLRLILDATKFLGGQHTIGPSDLQTQLTELGYKHEVYVSILPRVTLYSAHGAHEHKVHLDLRDFPEGVGVLCENDHHTMTRFEWNTSGPFSRELTEYVCCTDCGKQYTAPHLNVASFKKLFGSPQDGVLIVPQGNH